MKIAVFIKATTFHKNYGGLETLNKILCEGLGSRGYEITVFSPKRELTIDNIVQNGVRYVFVKCTFRQFFSHVDKNSWLNRSFEIFKDIHTKEHFDLVIGQSSGALGIIERKHELNLKVVSISHGSILSEYKTALKNISGPQDVLALARNTQYVLRTYFGSQRDFIRKSNKVIAVSNAVKRSIIDETFVPDSKVDVIFNGVDDTKFSSLTHTKNAKVRVLFVGRVIRSKGLFLLLDVFKSPKFSDSVLNIIGEGSDLAELKTLAANYGISDRVIFKGQLKHDAVIPELFANDIFVLPSQRVEGFPMTLVEAMFAGLPIVASNIGGISDAVSNEVNGFLVEPGNNQQLEAALVKLISSEDLRQKYGYNSKAKAQENFTLSNMLDKYEAVLTMYKKDVRTKER